MKKRISRQAINRRKTKVSDKYMIVLKDLNSKTVYKYYSYTLPSKNDGILFPSHNNNETISTYFQVQSIHMIPNKNKVWVYGDCQYIKS